MTPDDWEDRWPTKFDSYYFNHTIEEFIARNELADIWGKVHLGVNLITPVLHITKLNIWVLWSPKTKK